MKVVRSVAAALLATATLFYAAVPAGAQRTRTLLDDGWRFIKGDAPNVDTSNLLYDVRPLARGEDRRAREAEATTEAAKVDTAAHPVLKPWILPTGNRFIKDPSKQHIRPTGDPGSDNPYVLPEFDDRSWSSVRLPHDWAIAGPFNAGGVGGSMGRLPSPGVGWYRRKLQVPRADAGKSIVLQIDGAMSYAAVWLNGKLVGGWPYGYASWQLDLTPYLNFRGDNQLAIRLDNPPDFSRWYPGAGLYRHVWLLKTTPVHVGQQGTYVTTPDVSAAAATVKVKVSVDNDSKAESAVDVSTLLYVIDKEGTHPGCADRFHAPTAGDRGSRRTR